MDHPCYKCGHLVEDGKAFCSQCGAPQIRVIMPEATAPAAITGGVSSTELPIFSPDSPVIRVPALGTGIVWPRALRVCAVAAAIAVLITALRLMVPVLSVLSTGVLAVIFYRTRNPTWRGDARSGAQLGAVSGLVFSAISAIFGALAVVLVQSAQIRQQMTIALQELASHSTDPQIQAALDLLKRPEDLASKLLSSILLMAVFSVAAGSLAGALTGAFLGRRNRP
jgi:hypothetical protein